MTSDLSQLKSGSESVHKTQIKNARKARAVVWGAFALALLAATGTRFERTLLASDEIADSAVATHAALVQDGATTARVTDDIVQSLYGDTAGEASDAYRELIFNLAYHLSQSSLELSSEQVRETYRNHARRELLTNVIFVSFLHLGILIIFPAAFSTSIQRALRHLGRFRSQDPETFWDRVWYQRYDALLEEEAQWMIGRRLGLALILSFSLLYLFAPAGLMASAFGEYVRLHPIPGTASHPFWFTEADQVSPFVIGLAGFLLFSLITLAERTYTRNVSGRLFLSLWNRGVTVVVLSLALTAIDEGGTISKAMIFIAGIFPQTGLQAIAKIAQTGGERLAQIESRNLTGLPEIDSLKSSSLRELGITSTADLAAEDLAGWLITQSRIHPRVLVKAVDRALLQIQLGDLTEKLETIPIFTASELVLHALGDKAYKQRWNAANQVPKRKLSKPLTDDQVLARYKKLDEVLGTKNVELHVGLLMHNRNLMFILDNKLSYTDL